MGALSISLLKMHNFAKKIGKGSPYFKVEGAGRGDPPLPPMYIYGLKAAIGNRVLVIFHFERVAATPTRLVSEERAIYCVQLTGEKRCLETRDHCS